MELETEQTTDQTFRVTSTPEGRLGVAVLVHGKPVCGSGRKTSLRPNASRFISKLRSTEFRARSRRVPLRTSSRRWTPARVGPRPYRGGGRRGLEHVPCRKAAHALMPCKDSFVLRSF